MREKILGERAYDLLRLGGFGGAFWEVGKVLRDEVLVTEFKVSESKLTVVTFYMSRSEERTRHYFSSVVPGDQNEPFIRPWHAVSFQQERFVRPPLDGVQVSPLDDGRPLNSVRRHLDKGWAVNRGNVSTPGVLKYEAVAEGRVQRGEGGVADEVKKCSLVESVRGANVGLGCKLPFAVEKGVHHRAVDKPLDTNGVKGMLRTEFIERYAFRRRETHDGVSFENDGAVDAK
jgi:hypothetical protein